MGGAGNGLKSFFFFTSLEPASAAIMDSAPRHSVTLSLCRKDSGDWLKSKNLSYGWSSVC
jgi:hypothetical protein